MLILSNTIAELRLFGLNEHNVDNLKKRYHVLSLVLHPDSCLRYRNKIPKEWSWLPLAILHLTTNDQLSNEDYSSQCNEMFKQISDVYDRLNKLNDLENIFLPEFIHLPQADLIKLIIAVAAINKDLLNAKNNSGQSLASLAARSGFTSVLKALNKAGAKSWLSDSTDMSSLQIATQNHHIETVNFLLSQLPRDMEFDSLIIELLNITAENGYADFLEVFQRNHPNLDLDERSIFKPIFLAALNGHGGFIRALAANGLMAADSLKINISWVLGEQGSSPMHAAAQNNHVDVVRTLLDLNHELYPVNHNRITPAHLAGAIGNAEVLRVIAERDIAQFNAINENTFFVPGPLHLAAEKGHTSVFKSLKSLRGVNYLARNKSGMTVGHIAAANGHHELIEVLGEMGVDLNVNDNELNYTPAHVAAHNNHPNVIAALAKVKANLNFLNDNQHTPAHIAIMRNSLPVIRSLAAAGVRFFDARYTKYTISNSFRFDNDHMVTTKTYQYIESPLHLVVRNKMTDIFEFLVLNGIDVDCDNVSSPYFPHPSESATDDAPYVLKLHGHSALRKSVNDILKFSKTLTESNDAHAGKASEIAQQLDDMLKASFKTINNHQDLMRFKAEFKSRLHSLNSTFTENRSAWKVILANVLLALTGFGLLYVVGKPIHSKLTTGQFTFFYQKRLSPRYAALDSSANNAIRRFF